jgi:prepilin-type N-terminal cleavage/methylation domain-containing protein
MSRQRGMTLIELMVAMALLGVVQRGVPPALTGIE